MKAQDKKNQVWVMFTSHNLLYLFQLAGELDHIPSSGYTTAVMILGPLSVPVSGRQTERYMAELSLPRKPEMPPSCEGSPAGTWAQEHHKIMPECEGKERPHFSFSLLHIQTSMAYFSFFNF